MGHDSRWRSGHASLVLKEYSNAMEQTASCDRSWLGLLAIISKYYNSNSKSHAYLVQGTGATVIKDFATLL